MWLSPLLDLIFPPSCEVCRRRGQEALCPDCFAQIKFIKPQLGVHSVSAYDGVLKTALHRLKFQKRAGLAEPLGIMLVKYLSQATNLKIKELDGIVPVPLHRRRQRARGFNQAALLAGVIGRYFELPVLPLLERFKDTRPQYELPRAARLVNIKDSFRVTNQEQARGKRWLLVDDIYTTGATVSECSRMLSQAGAARVEILTLSRVIEDRA